MVERLSRIVDRKASRRGFLSKTAMGATAMAVAPAVFATRPGSAQDVIGLATPAQCPRCLDGYTDFCCFIYGQNLCPPGTLVAGWWKADGSGMCDLEGEARPRYYLDCNRECYPGSTCGGRGVCGYGSHDGTCGCADGCGSRMKDCTQFRYGQCNQDVPCVGAIACRIVTCVPPWQWDTSCTTAPRTDNRTRFHDRPCLHDGFTDVAPNAFYTAAVAWAVEQEITTGYTDDLFGPDEITLRSHFSTFLWRYALSPPVDPNTDFVDVAPGSFYEQAVAWMVAEGITSGTTETTFSPDDPVLRAEALTFLWRWAGEPEAEATHTFEDVPADSFYADAVAWGHSIGLTLGVTETMFGGGQQLTRAEAVTFLHRFGQLVGRQ